MRCSDALLTIHVLCNAAGSHGNRERKAAYMLSRHIRCVHAALLMRGGPLVMSVPWRHRCEQLIHPPQTILRRNFLCVGSLAVQWLKD
jgi:hypothetical protein